MKGIPMMILVTGAAGHTGLHLLKELFHGDRDVKVRCLVRKSSQMEGMKDYPVDLVFGDLEDDEEQLSSAFEGVDLVIHIANIRYSPKVCRLCDKNKVRKVVLVHTTGMYSKFREYAEEYQKIECEIVQSCKTPYVILRPTMIYGSEMDHNMHKLIRYIQGHRFFPVFGNGKGLMQPVHAGDLAKAIHAALLSDKTMNKAYNISGGSEHEYREILKLIASRVNPGIHFIFIPLSVSILLGSLYNGLSRLLGRKAEISIEQIRRLSENKNYDFIEASRDFGYAPVSFREGIMEEIERMGYSS